MAAASSLEIVCPHDGAVNRVPAARLRDTPRCGKCHLELFTGDALELGSADFDRQLTRNQLPLLVDFWASWCGPCRMMAPAFQQAAGMLEPEFRLAKVNTESAPDIAGRYAIRSIPTMILFAGGREIARHSGAMTSATQIGSWARGAIRSAG